MKNRNLKHSDNWATPPEFYEALNREFNFDFDPCPLNYGAITPDTDGLLIEWGDRNYVNPPYSRALKEAFVLKAIEESTKGKLCVMLLPVSTSTKLFHGHIQPSATEICFVKGRIPFIGLNDKGQRVNFHLKCKVTDEVIYYDGKPIPKYVKNSGQHDSMIVVFDGREKCN